MNTKVAGPRPVLFNHRALGTANDQWYTPPLYIEAARAVMGAIDLDPASSAMAQQIVLAGAYFTAEDDGLQYDWHGRIWLNPPYSRANIGEFLRKLEKEYLAGRVTEAIVMTHAYCETRWFQSLEKLASKLCFPSRRIRFWSPDGGKASPTQGQAIFYLGPNGDLFAKVFGQFGFVR